MLVYEYKLSGSKKQYAAIDEAIRIVQFIRNKSLRLWMDGEKVSKNDLQTNCKVLAKNITSLVVSILWPVRRLPNVHGLPFLASTTIVAELEKGDA